MLDQALITTIEEKKSNVQGFMGKKALLIGIETNQKHLGYILGWSFCSDIMIYNPFHSKAKPYIGKYEGHNSIIIDCKLMNHTPCCVSIDEKKILRIWSIHDFSTLQIMSLEFIVSMIKIVQMLPDDSFLIGSRRIFYYHNLDLKNQLALLGQSQPVKAVFSDHYKNFMVLTRYDMRVFSPITGKLSGVFTDIAKQDSDYSVQVSSFCVGARDRKFYLGDTEGNIQMFNLKSGQLLKVINSPDDDYNVVEKLAQATFYRLNQRIDRKVCCMVYLHEEKIIISAANSVIYLHDEIDSEESELIKVFIGGHDEAEITSLKYMEDHNILFSGASNGIISVWDLKCAKHLTVLIGHNSRIIDMFVLGTHNALLSISADSHVCIWNLGGRNNLKYKLTARFVIHDLEKAYTTDRSRSVISAMLWVRNARRDEARREPLLEQRTSTAIDRDPVSQATLKSMSELFQAPFPIRYENKYKHSDFVSFFVEDYAITKVQEDSMRYYLVLGTDNGDMIMSDLLPYIKRSVIDDISRHGGHFSHVDSKIRRKDHITAQKSVASSMAYEIKNFKILTECYDMLRSICIARWHGHEAGVNSIEPVNSTEYLLTCSADQTAKIWNLKGELNSSIILMESGASDWQFYFDWISVTKQDFDQVFRVVEIVQGQKICQQSRDDILNDHLIRTFINAVDQSKADDKSRTWKKVLKKSLLKESSLQNAEKMDIVDKNKTKKDKHIVNKSIVPQIDKVMAKSSNYQRAKMLGTGFQSSLAGELDKEFKVISKEEENKIIGSGFASLSNKVLTEMRKPRCSKRYSVLFKNQVEMLNYEAGGKSSIIDKSNQNSRRLISHTKLEHPTQKLRSSRRSILVHQNTTEQSTSKKTEETYTGKSHFLATTFQRPKMNLKDVDLNRDSARSSASHFRVKSYRRDSSRSRKDSHGLISTSRWNTMINDDNEKSRTVSPARSKKSAEDNKKRVGFVDRFNTPLGSPNKLARVHQQSSFAKSGLNEFSVKLSQYFNTAEEELSNKARAFKFSIIAKPLIDIASSSKKQANSPGLNSQLMKQKIAEFMKSTSNLKSRLSKNATQLPIPESTLEIASKQQEKPPKHAKSLRDLKSEVLNRMKKTAKIIDGQNRFMDKLTIDYGKASSSRISVINHRSQSHIIKMSNTTNMHRRQTSDNIDK